MKVPTNQQVSDAISLCQVYWLCNAAFSSQFGQKLYAHLVSQEETIKEAAREGKLTKEHLSILMQTPLTSSSSLPSLMESAIENAGSNRVQLSDSVSRMRRSTDPKIRFNASFSMILISNHFHPLPRMFELQSIISGNLTERQYCAIVNAAADALVLLCKETMDRDIATRTLFFFNEHSSIFSTQIKNLHALPIRISRAPAQIPSGDGKMGTPRGYPQVSKRQSLADAPPSRKRLGTIRPKLPSQWSGPNTPKERY